ncbi:calmodulin-binding transcription activator 2 isoform X2 [Andrographis paniculata]|nr:calmodulin-binding transcription activator 2 isoform X2 [Andrographis paniculata]
MLHCYYAHGEDNENFQRRSYWLLETDLMHIVFVHYLEVKGNKTNISYARNSDRVASNSENDGSMSSSFCGTSPTSHLSSAYEDTESEGNHQASSRLHLYPESPLTDDGHSAQSSSYNQLYSPGNSSLSYASLPRGRTDGDFEGGSLLTGSQATTNVAPWKEYIGTTTGDDAYKPELMPSLPLQSNWPVINNFFEGTSLPPNQGFLEQKEQSGQRNLQMLLSNIEPGSALNQNLENPMPTLGNENNSFLLKKPLLSGLQTEESLKKVDSFSRWIAKELGDVDELDVQRSSGISWSIMGNEDDSTMSAPLQVDMHTLNPSISQDQLFSIIDFSPSWAYSNLETKIVVTGIFLKSEQELYECRWSIMFGEVEVPAEVLANGTLCCLAPLQNPGVVPFYITCSNRLACSEIREFDYRPEQNIHLLDISRDKGAQMHLYQRFEMILDLEPTGSPINCGNDFEKRNIIDKLVSLIDEESNHEARLTPENDKSHLKVIGELLLERRLKEKFYSWLLRRVTEDGKGPMAIDAGGQGVLHLAAALGFSWAIQPMITAGVSIDFRDANGWTALHWAAFCGREDTVAALVALGAASGPLTDPTADCPQGSTPYDLASCCGHKGISGYLGEASLTSLVSTLKLKDDVIPEAPGFGVIQTVSERSAVPTTGEEVPDALSLKDSLAAVCNATQAASRIHQIFRIQSFQRKWRGVQGSDDLLTPEEQAVIGGKSSRLGHSDGMMANAAAVRIQKKYRGWKTRKDFLQIRQKIVKIQAHVRGHQVRKKYKPIIWSVGILEKVILRWRRKRSGLRGFRSDVQKGSSMQEDNNTLPPQEDDYDFLKEGRKQAEERMDKALARVKSMVQYPEARAQYRRLLTAAEGFRDTKETSNMMIPDNVEDMGYGDEELIDVSSLLDDETFMSLAFQ